MKREGCHELWTSHCKLLSVHHYLTTSAQLLPEAAVLTSSLCSPHYRANLTVHQTAFNCLILGLRPPSHNHRFYVFSLFSFVWQAVSSKNDNFSFCPCNKKYNFAQHVDKQYNLSVDLKTICSFQIHLVIMSCLSPLLELVFTIFEGTQFVSVNTKIITQTKADMFHLELLFRSVLERLSDPVGRRESRRAFITAGCCISLRRRLEWKWHLLTRLPAFSPDTVPWFKGHFSQSDPLAPFPKPHRHALAGNDEHVFHSLVSLRSLSSVFCPD